METVVAQEILLEKIQLSETNKMFRIAAETSDRALNELAASIKQFGIIQPILVRPKEDGTFNLICGERRVRASKLAGLTSIPASIREVNDEQALIIQITENIERENVHPLNEAKGYKLLLEQDEHMNTATLALKFGKSETYIAQRLKLNDLVREARKDFYAGRINIGHATLLARLTPAAQREAIDSITNFNGSYGTVNDLQNFIDREIMNDLSKAPFDPLDEDLVKKAGACNVCPKRSGSQPKLFAEIKEKDRCFDQTCFWLKCEKFLINKVREIIETQPDIVFLASYHEPAEKIVQLITDHKLSPLKESSDFFTHKTGGSKIKGLWISGHKAGQVETVHLKHEVKEAAGEKGNVKVVVARINQRLDRAVELDSEKVYAKILDALKSHSTQKKSNSLPLLEAEEAMLWFIIFDKAGYHIREEVARFIGLKDEPEKVFSKLSSLSPLHKAFMLRKVMLNQYGSVSPDTSYGFIIRKVAEGYGDIDIAGFEKEQQEIRDKRETRAKDRIKLLKQSKK